MNIMKKLSPISILCIGILFASVFLSCESKTKTLDDSLFGYEYYPLEIGKYWVYQLDSTIIDDQGAKIIKSKNYIREEVTDSYLNEENETIFKIQRSISDSLYGTYRITDIWTAEMTETAAFRVEENLRFIKMVFPVNLDKSWVGNLFDNLTQVDVAGEKIWVYKDWGEYRIDQYGVDRQINGKLYKDVVKVEQADHDFAIERRFSVEYYAANIGMIEREMVIFDTQCECPGQTWEQKADSGFTLRQTLLETN